MTGPSNTPPGKSVEPLRERALRLLSASGAQWAAISPADLPALIHELQVHQMELQIQNEDLRSAQLELADARDRYFDLFEFAPVGYLRLDSAGRTLEANQTAARLLGVDRSTLLARPLTEFIARDSQDVWYLQQQNLKSGGAPPVCELRLRRNDGSEFMARLESAVSGSGDTRTVRTALSDISELHRARRELQESELRYRRMTLALTDSIYRASTSQGRVVETVHGTNCELVTGFRPEEFATNPRLWSELAVPEDRPLMEEQVARLMSGQESPPIEHRILRKDGGVRWVRHTIVAERDASGQLVAYDGMLRDITGRKLAEEALQRLNLTLEDQVRDQTEEIRLLASAMASLAEGVIILAVQYDPSTSRVVYVNEALCRISGYSAVELIGRSPRIILGPNPDPEIIERLRTRLLAGLTVMEELVGYRKDGTPFDLELLITPIARTDSAPTHFVAIHRDVTERKRAVSLLKDREERLRAILNTASNAIITINEQGIITSVNPATEVLFGYGPVELVGQNVSRLMPPPHCDLHDGYIARFLRTGEARIIGAGREVVARRKDGSLFPAELAISQVDHLGLFTGIVIDISERKQLQRHLLEIASDEQRRIGQELHDGTGQELTGLTLIATSLRNIFLAIPETRLEGAAVRILREPVFSQLSDRLVQLTQKLAESSLHMQQLSRGIMPVQIDAQGLRSALAELAATVTAGGETTCRVDCPADFAVADNTTATQLYRIAQEALNNAVRHGRATDVCISLEHLPDRSVLRIRDNGVGFDPLLAASRRSKTAGSGLGMRTMEYRAGMIGGTLLIARGEGGGTTVSCTVFGSVGDPSTDRRPEIPTPTSPEGVPRAGGGGAL